MEQLSYLLQLTNIHKKWSVVEICQTSQVNNMVELEVEECELNICGNETRAVENTIIAEHDEQQQVNNMMESEVEEYEMNIFDNETYAVDNTTIIVENDEHIQDQLEQQLQDQPEQELEDQQEHQKPQQLQVQLNPCIENVKLPLIRKARGRPKNIDTTVIGIKRQKRRQK